MRQAITKNTLGWSEKTPHDALVVVAVDAVAANVPPLQLWTARHVATYNHYWNNTMPCIRLATAYELDALEYSFFRAPPVMYMPQYRSPLQVTCSTL